MINFKKRLSKELFKNIPQLAEEEILMMIEIPPNSEMGDFAFPCFKLAKVFKKAPNIIADDIAKGLDKGDFIDRVEIAGGYLNFFIDREYFIETVLGEVLLRKETYGSSLIGDGKNVIVEFSSPNIAKPFHIGHIRTTVIGSSLYNIYKFLGYNTIAINHLGDYGTQFGKLIVAFKNWGNEEEVRTNPIAALLDLYVKFHKEAETKPELEDESRQWFKKLENGDDEAVKLWEWFREVSLEEFNRVYDILDITFDSFAGESFYSDKMPAVINMMEERGIIEKSDGADIVDLEPFGLPPALIKKGDGSTLYITRDLAAAIYRKETYDFYKNIYVVGSQQILHFQQMKKILYLMGFEWEKDCVHVPFGMVGLEDGTMSTREGRVVFLEDVLNKAVEKTRDIINEKNPNLENLDEIAKQVGIGAVIFEELSNNRIKDYTFTWDKVLNFEGETGPYVQYTHARASSVLKRAGTDIDSNFKPELLADDITLEILREIQQFPEIVEDAQRKNEPSIITRHIIDIAQAFNRFYHEHPILVEDEELKKARLVVVFAVKQVLSIGLALLGIKAPEKM
ncbi:MAG TPA: arginine--tRNA ligase [Clostridia bacterium]|nr:arginine--tRNA ligase [Clostridia bacterium]